MADGQQSSKRTPPSRNLDRDILYALTGLEVPDAVLGADGGLPRLSLSDLARVVNAPEIQDDDVERLCRVGLVHRGGDGRLHASAATVHFVGIIGYVA
jgi:hypothetical protein